jgi:hypothetical protein
MQMTMAQAAGQALVDAGATMVTCVPATGAVTIYAALCERLLKSYSEFVHRMDASDPAALLRTLRAAQESNRMEIVVAEFPL